jgi:hypothetical protein
MDDGSEFDATGYDADPDRAYGDPGSDGEEPADEADDGPPYDALATWAVAPPSAASWTVDQWAAPGSGGDLTLRCAQSFTFNGERYDVLFHAHCVQGDWVFGGMWAEGLRWRNYRLDGANAPGGINIQRDVADTTRLSMVVEEIFRREAPMRMPPDPGASAVWDEDDGGAAAPPVVAPFPAAAPLPPAAPGAPPPDDWESAY